MKPVWIELVENGVANRFDFPDEEVIEINWRLTNNPDLYKRILEHELSHADGNFKFKDLVHDMKSRTPGLHRFMIKHPSTWTQVLPLYYDRKKKTLVYDISTTVAWLMIIGITYGLYSFLGWLL